ncbi:MAG: 2,3,4,5-tetrahydropyridine-2,6-dicarboxylate N-succinyltransferase [Patescibacteria group bacterium]|nr:2,3,4,5-tetrahydropyridine-2,6-dicarboxylate N-succinyltransferase [Patescibacteria group bacterium]
MPKVINTVEDFKNLVSEIESQKGYRRPLGFGICSVDYGQLNKNKVLQATYPVANWNENFGSAAIFISALQENDIEVDFTQDEAIFDISYKFMENCLNKFAPYIQEAYGNSHKNVQVLKHLFDGFLIEDEPENELIIIPTNEYDVVEPFKICFIFDDAPLKSVEATYLKLYALSTAKAELRSLNLNGAFATLPNVAWSNGEPIELDWLRENEIKLKLIGKYPKIDFVDKFPRYLQHIIPADNTRILDDAKVRFGAQIAAGTTVMPGASYINFNSGTTGPVMVEGRISSSAIVGTGSDIGGGASILGVLSGTDGNPITIGKNTLLGANSTCGIPIGDACIIDGGLAILAGTKLSIEQDELDKIIEANPGFTAEKATKYENEQIPSLPSYLFKAKDLAGLNGLHFRHNSVNGRVEVHRSVREVKLNADLH